MSGRQQGLVTKPSKHTKSRDEQADCGNENLVQHHHDSRSKQPLRYQESHHGRNREREIPGDRYERREYEWHMRRYGRGDQVHSRPAPPVGRSEKRPHNDERVLQLNPPRVDNQRGYNYAEIKDYNDSRGRYVYVDYEDYKNDGHRRHEQAEYEDYNNDPRRYDYSDYADYEDCNNESVPKSNHGYGHDVSVQISKEEYTDRRILVDSEHGAVARNLVPVEDSGHGKGYGQDRGRGQGYEENPQPVRLRQDHGLGQGYEQDPQPIKLRHDRGHGHGYGQSSQSYPTLEMRRSKEEIEHYQEMPPEEYHVESYYKDKEKCAHQSRKLSHSSTSPQLKDFANQHFPKGAPPSTSSGVVRDDDPNRVQNVDPHPFDGYPKNPELSENLGAQEYGQRAQLELRKDYEAAGFADMKCHQCDPYAYSWNEHEDYAYVNAESSGKDDPGYRTHDALYREDRAHARLDTQHRYLQRVAIAKPIAENPTKAEGSHRIYGHNGLRELEISQKEEMPGYEDSRPLVTSTQEADCLNSGYAPAEFARRASQGLQLNEASVLHEHEISVYDHGRYVNFARNRGERVKSSAELVDPEDLQRHVEREPRYADEQVAYNRMVKRKYLQGEEAEGFTLGTAASHKWNTYSGSKQVEDRRPEWNHISSSGLHSQVPSGCEPNLFLEAEDMMNEISHRKDSVRYCWSDPSKCENMQEQSVKSFEPGRKYMKAHPKSEYSRGYGRSHYTNHSNDRYKQQYYGKRGEEEISMDFAAEDHYFSENPKGHFKYDLCEDSESFKQSVLAAFLMYSKKLNENPPVRRLYKHHGNSGTLFCIVCGRSASKLFRDTEGLTKHAHMARKASLRAQHLGLHRAICVLMGWDIEVPPDNITWVPLSLPQPEAMAQKEDLIIWQPTVIVHNITLSNNNHKEWKVINLEAIEGIIRGKSFIRSKIKICLGYPGDQSVMLVKFLGTFTGLQEAEKLHKYFAEEGRGRADFEQAISDMNKNGGNPTVEDESLLYGYIGIAEDLDRIDHDTKRRCKIQSKREIQVLVDAPLKRE